MIFFGKCFDLCGGNKIGNQTNLLGLCQDPMSGIRSMEQKAGKVYIKCQ